jgi:hypothetical protein
MKRLPPVLLVLFCLSFSARAGIMETGPVPEPPPQNQTQAPPVGPFAALLAFLGLTL